MANKIVFNPLSGTFDFTGSSSGSSSNSFTTIQTPAGTSPVASSATDTLTYTSSDSTITITGNSSTDTVDIKLASPVGATKGGTAQTTYTKGDILYASAANTLSKLSVGTTAQHLVISSTGVPIWDNANNPSQVTQWVDDFDSASSAGSTGWGNNSTSGGDAKVQSPLDNTHIGITRLQTGTTTTGVGNIFKDVSMFMGGATLNWETLVQIPNLSDNTDTFIVELGMHNGFNSSPFSGLWFSYSNTLNSGNWTANTGNGSVTSTSTGIAAGAGSWVRLGIIGAADGSHADFYINGTNVATISSTMPTASAQKFGHSLQITKSAGTTERLCYVDYVRFISIFTTSR